MGLCPPMCPRKSYVARILQSQRGLWKICRFCIDRLNWHGFSATSPAPHGARVIWLLLLPACQADNLPVRAVLDRLGMLRI
jgi:hypothetical protein